MIADKQNQADQLTRRYYTLISLEQSRPKNLKFFLYFFLLKKSGVTDIKSDDCYRLITAVQFVPRDGFSPMRARAN